MTDNLSTSLEKFLTAADWLTDAEAPAVSALRLMAKTLDAQDADEGIIPSLMSQYMNSYRNLYKLKPKITTEAVDPIEALLTTDGPQLMTLDTN